MVFILKGKKQNLKKAIIWFKSIFGNKTVSEMKHIFETFPLVAKHFKEISSGIRETDKLQSK